MAKQKIAIACQGGGSQTAFTAGVLSAFFERELHLKKQIVSLSGTSGGAVCAAVAWYGLLKAAAGDPIPIEKRIKDFWEEIIAQIPPELYVDQFSAEMLRLIENGVIPHLELSPVSALSQMFISAVTAFLPRRYFTDLKGVLEAHIAFEELPNLVRPTVRSSCSAQRMSSPESSRSSTPSRARSGWRRSSHRQRYRPSSPPSRLMVTTTGTACSPTTHP